MKKLQVSQKKNEAPDFFVMRAYAKALPLLGNDELRAMVHWIHSHAFAEIIRRKRPGSDGK